MKVSRIGLLCALAAFVIHAAGNANYGFFRDELYFIVCGWHPAAGYVDQPSLTPVLAALSQSFGISLFALRLIPAVCAAIAIYVACVLAEDFGGGVFAQAVAGLVTIVAPELMALGSRLSPDSIELCTWSLIALLMLRITRGADPRWWLAVGALTAVAFWGKYTVVFFVAALVVGLLLTPQRRALRSVWFAAGATLAVALVLPNVLWQVQNGFPMLQLLRNDYGKFVFESPPFPLQQIVIMSPLLSVVWLVGLVWLLAVRGTRFLGIAYLALIAVMWFLDAKNYYAAPVYPYLIAAGAIPIERWTASRAALRPAVVAAILIFAIPSTPFVLPILPMPSFIAYQETLGRIFHLRFHFDPRAGNDVPVQHFADMTGWPELTGTVASVYRSLPPSERAQAAIFAHSAGEAAAIDIYGKAYGLPPALSGNNNYWIWGPRGFSGNVLIDVNDSVKDDRARFQSVKLAAIFRNPYAMPYENNVRIYICRGIREPLAAQWPKLRDYSYGLEEL